jgi:hypothetical protein
MRWIALLLLAACEKDGADDPPADDTDPVDTDTVDTVDDGTVELEEVITVTEVSPGDLTCAGGDPATWAAPAIGAGCVEPVPLQGTIEDFQSGDAVEGMQVEIFLGDDPDAAADFTATSDASGTVTGGDIPTCTPFSSRATNGADPDAPPALQMHWSEAHTSPMNAFFNSVDSGTLSLMSALLGVTADSNLGFSAGTIYGCDADRTPLAGAQVVLRSADGTYPSGQNIHYFIEDFPAREETQTSADGLFLIVNVPPGAYTIEAWAVASAGAAPSLIASTTTRLYAGSLTVTDMYAGDADGVVLPSSCYAECPPLGL